MYVGQHTGPVELGELAPHGLRLLSVHADVGRPQIVGSTGHLLGEAMDLDDERWDPARRILTLTPSEAGPAARRGDLVVCDPNGPLRRVPFSAAGPRPIQLQFG